MGVRLFTVSPAAWYPVVLKAMRGKGFELAQNGEVLKDTAFRIGNMGWIPAKSIDHMLAALAEFVS